MIDHNERNKAVCNANKEWLRLYHLNDNVLVTYRDGNHQFGTIVGFDYNCFNEVILRIQLVKEYQVPGSSKPVDTAAFLCLHPGNKTFEIERL